MKSDPLTARRNVSTVCRHLALVAVDGATEEVALTLDPSSGLVQVPYSELLIWWRGDRERGVRIARAAVAHEPLSPDRNVQVGFVLLTAGLYDEAIALFRKALQLDPHYATAQLWLAPVETSAAGSGRSAVVGTDELARLPSPSSPLPPRPQQRTCPAVVTKQLCSRHSLT